MMRRKGFLTSFLLSFTNKTGGGGDSLWVLNGRKKSITGRIRCEKKRIEVEEEETRWRRTSYSKD